MSPEPQDRHAVTQRHRSPVPTQLLTDALPGQTFTFSGTAQEGFETLYGIPTAALGEDCDRLMALVLQRCLP